MSNRTNAPRPDAGSAARVQAQRETAGNLEITARRLDLLLKGKAAIESDEARNTRYEEAIEALLLAPSTVAEEAISG